MNLPLWAKQALIPLILIMGLVISELVAWNKLSPSKWLTVAPAPQIDATPRIPVQLESPIKVYPQPVKQKLKLPPAYQQDKNKSVVAATEVKPGNRAQTIITVADTQTGDVETLVRAEPLPWLAFERHGHIRIDYGFNGSKQITRLSLQQDLIQAKALHGGVSASLDSDKSYFIGIGGGFKW